MINNKNILTVAAGFPSPAENYIEEKLNLDKHLYTSNVPVVSMFAEIIGTPFQLCEEYLKRNSRSNETSERLLIVERFGRISTFEKSNFINHQLLFKKEFKYLFNNNYDLKII